MSLRELIASDIISPEDASELISHVESGSIPLSQAFLIVKQLLDADMTKDIKNSLSKEQVDEIEYLKKIHKDGFISDKELEKRVGSITNSTKGK